MARRRPAALGGLADLLTRGLRGRRRNGWRPGACHVTGLDMARQTLRGSRGAGRGPWRRGAATTGRSSSSAATSGTSASSGSASCGCAGLRENTGSSSSDEAEFDADDDDLCLTVQKMPFEACRPTCNCAYDFPRASPSSDRRAFGRNAQKGALSGTPSGCWFSRASPAGHWVGAVDKAEADAPWDSPVRLLVTTPAAYSACDFIPLSARGLACLRQTAS